MPDMQESIASAALTEVVDEQNPDLHEVPIKKGNRQRLLHRIQRISSSPSLVSIGRPRARSTPYRGKGHLSCVSLSGAPIASITDGSDSYFPAGASASDYANASDRQAGTPASEKAHFDANVRRIETGVTPFNPLTPGAYTIGLPTDIKTVSKILLANHAMPKKNFDFWKDMPHEISVHIFSFLRPKQLVQASRTSKSFHGLCFDGQLWTSFDASQFHDEIPAESLAKIIVAAGPFIKDLNLRGCVQVEHYHRAEVVVKACQNLLDATLEGCRNFQRSLTAVTNMSCTIIAEACPQLQRLDVSWCTHMDARGIKAVVKGCAKLTDLRAREIRGFDNLEVAEVLYRTNNLERLILNGCADLDDRALMVMVQGEEPEIDILTDIPVVPRRKWRHLDLSRCTRLTSRGDCLHGQFPSSVASVSSLDQSRYSPPILLSPRFIVMPDMQESIASPALTEVVDEQNPDLHEVPVKKGNRQRLLHRIQRISSSPSLVSIGRPRARSTPYRGKGHLSCVSLSGGPITSITDGSDSYFPAGASASDYANASDRQAGTPASEKARFDANVRRIETGVTPFNPLTPGAYTIGLPTDIKPVPKILLATPAIPKKNFDFWKDMPHEISVHIFSFLRPKELVQASRISKSFHELCFDGQLWTSFDASQFHDEIPAESLAKIIVAAGPFIKDLNLRGCVQMTIDEHMKRVLRGDFAAASRLERRWADYMQANEEAGATGAGHRRRRRRAREAQMLHADEEEGGIAHGGRRRARTVAAACAVM
ncbi:hypothetical protein BN1723_011373 [Verticillium longisporum]|uniref:F-box domain-containing protein n=1 Tax=Verticillium longisporum TaxID=100787 RepID=A0A0G4L6P9_VERLO|nr:hypothetical protein BN1723_011373 [Verticillium longisporum]